MAKRDAAVRTADENMAVEKIRMGSGETNDETAAAFFCWGLGGVRGCCWG